MAVEITDSFFRDWDTSHKYLLNLPLYRIYRHFYIYYSIKKKENAVCDRYIESNLSHAGDTLSICRGIELILEKRNYRLSFNNSVTLNKYCEYTSYFLYDKLKNSSTYIHVKELYEALKHVQKEYGLSDETCNIINFDIDKEKLERKKELYFHSEILHWIKWHSAHNLDESLYNTYFSECANSYREITNDQECKYFPSCEKELQIFKEKFNETKEFLKGKSINIREDNIQLHEKHKCLSEKEKVKPEEKEPEGFPSHAESATIGGDSNTEAFSVDGSNPMTDKTLGIVLGIISGIFLLFLIVYKFTPFGFFFRGKIRKTKEKINAEFKNDELVINTPEYENINLYNDI
ncbi:PIR Superfamily Protein [Plasmodium ovale wallikeri]|uniref:PIR Superfamily Protein n=1 Tax=Plasmodium ovale wallikeri TaxID=864142 RepID=A0A1A9A859_PLAOA|nr:PIR Superfamily Protein [Plasmodium ovale wallikeri]SBT57031.1 PIR Superfamily Protein [Plasmodium ovale wallikeri]